jgi:hypothetical protein
MGYTGTPVRVVAVDDFSEEAFDKIRAEDFDVMLLYSREWRPEWNLLQEWPVLETLRGKLYGRHPQADTEWIRRRYKLVSLGSVRLGGQWVEWLGTLDLGGRRRESARLDFRLEPNPLVGAVAERLVLRMPAAAQPDGGAPRKIKRGAGGVADREFPFDAHRPVVVDSDFGHGK